MRYLVSGPYASHAIPIFARNSDMATHDVNIVRLVRRWHDVQHANLADIVTLASRYVPRGRSCAWHSALMDFASLICTKRAPQYALCASDSVSPILRHARSCCA